MNENKLSIVMGEKTACVASITLGSAVQFADKHPSSLPNFICLPIIGKKRTKKMFPFVNCVHICKEMKQCTQKQSIEVYR